MDNEFRKKVCLQQSVLQRHARKFTNDEHQIKDLVQETLVKAFENQHRFKEGTNLQAWLYVLLRNSYYNGFRRKDFFQKVIVPRAFNLKAVAENDAFSRFLHADIESALSLIPAECASAVFQYAQGYKYAEISDALHTPIGTIKSRINQARNSLRSHLHAYLNQSGQINLV